MPRYFAPISVKEFEEKMADCEGKHGGRPYPHSPQILKDLKVNFDLENYETNGRNPEEKKFLGYNVLPNGMSFCGMMAGGDWEFPVYFILYWDGKQIRAYIPTKGNLWNTTTNQAYGNDPDDDDKDIYKRFYAEEEKDMDPEDRRLRPLCWEDCDQFFSIKDMLEDIQERILPQGSAKPTTNKKAPCTKKTSCPKNTLQQRIEALEFWGTGDEAYELFQAACSFCYQLYGLGDSAKAEVVCGWAKEMAEFSKKYWDENRSDDDPDMEHGQWGY